MIPAEIRAFCLDFNWRPGEPKAFAAPGLWADASPAEHVRWYQDLGANLIQTYCVSCNGYAWYQGGRVPPQPGLRSDFLPEIVRLGHAADMAVIGYFCIGANQLWGQRHPEQSYGTPPLWHIPLTDAYLEYLGASIAEAVTLSGVDGLMVDWIWNPDRTPNGGQWLPAEQALYAQLMGEPFPGEAQLDSAQEVAYGRRAIDRCWGVVQSAAKSAKADCLLWLCCNDLDHPHVRGSRLLREVDWLMNEHPDPARLAVAQAAAGPQAQILQCLCGWGAENNARVVLDGLQNTSIGLYGFAMPDASSFPPESPAPDDDHFIVGNAPNIDIIRQEYRRRRDRSGPQ